MNTVVFLLFLLVAAGVYWYTRRLVGRMKKTCPKCGATTLRMDATSCPRCGSDLRKG